jgi:hypothetical protein
MYNRKNLNEIARNVDMITRIFIILVTVTGITTIVTGVASFNVSQAQLLTPEEKSSMCDPNNPRLKFVNTTESKVCGIPKTPTNQTNSTTIATPTKSLTPSATIHVNPSDLVIRDVSSRMNVTSINRINGQDRVLTPVYLLTQNNIKGDPDWRVFHYIWKENPKHYDVEAIVGVMPSGNDQYHIEVGKLTNRTLELEIDGNRTITIPADTTLGQVNPGHIMFTIPRK